MPEIRVPDQAREGASILNYIDTAVARTLARTVAELGLLPERKFVDNPTAAFLMSITPDHLSLMRGRGEGPPHSGEGRFCRYSVAAITAWLEALPRKQKASE